jgi:hypothetical protein
MPRLLAYAVAAAAALALAAAGPAQACCIRVQLRAHHPKTDPPPLAIGDSVMIAAAHRLARRGFEVDAREGRFMRSALRILRTRRRTHTRPDTVVVALGTNFPPTAKEIRAALRLLGPHSKLALVTPLRSWRPLAAPAIWRARHNHPRRVEVLDWAAMSAPHPEWFWGDGTHLRPDGARAYSRLLCRALPGAPAQSASR